MIFRYIYALLATNHDKRTIRYTHNDAMSLPEPSLPGPNQIAKITLKPKIHTSQLIATANQKIDLEVLTVLEVTRHHTQ